MLGLFGGIEKLKLNAVDAVDAVDEQNQDEDKSNLHPVLNLCDHRVLGNEAVVSSLGAAMRHVAGCVGTYVKILRLRLNGKGRMRSMNKAISSTSSTNTCRIN